MKNLIERLGGALTTIVVTALLALFAFIFDNHEENTRQDSELKLIRYKLSELEKDFEKHESNHND